ncbi:NAD-dependent epimerase/dehydratase family protein [Streptomyces sp. NPDC050560]|uniref:NAD-dependent epimerase/dehydratase family protein n=1 Tax=Streptomyces sp. NPDC050560 TaxID=3365630 RepID=UPI00378AC9AA
MRVLVTGDRGVLGRAVRAAVEADGHVVTGYDLASGDDVRDAAALASAALDQDAIVHLAGLPGDQEDNPDQVMAVNLAGTWNVLLAARATGVRRVVHASSGKALGMLERDPDYLPVDDRHRGLPSKPYALSKWLSEEMCEAFTRDTGITTICLRPVFVADEAAWEKLSEQAELPPARGAAWHLGAVVDVRDVANAFVAALTCPDPTHARLLLCADDVAADRPTVEVLREHLPDVPWRGASLGTDSRTALADSAAARSVLGWSPRHGWWNRGGRRGS